MLEPPNEIDRSAAATAVKGYVHALNASILGRPRQENDFIYPAPLVYHGGPVVEGAIIHNIVQLASWAPNWEINAAGEDITETPLRDLLLSYNNNGTIALLDQYLATMGDPDDIQQPSVEGGWSASARYSLGQDWGEPDDPKAVYSGVVLDNDNYILPIIHNVALADSRYSHYGPPKIYNFFLPPGVKICLASIECYDPSNTLALAGSCGWHGSVDFPDVGHVLYIVIPYQKVPHQCNYLEYPSPKVKIDLTLSAVTRLLFGTITNPDGNAWYFVDPAKNIEEISDECILYSAFVLLHGTQYELGGEYSNNRNACTVLP